MFTTRGVAPTLNDSAPPADAPIWLLHCSGSSARQWRGLRALLPPEMAIVAPDLIGYSGPAHWANGAAVTLDDEARRLEAMMDVMMGTDRGPVHLVGHSYGGAVALQLALLAPHRVKSLTLYEPVRFALLQQTGLNAAWADIVTVGHEIVALTASGRCAAAAHLFVDYWSGSGAWFALPPAQRAGITLRMPKVRAEFEALFTDTLALSQYADLEMPIELLKGTESPLPVQSVVDLLGQTCPTAFVTRLEGWGHMGPRDHPERFVAYLPVLVRANTEQPRLSIAA